MGYVVIGIAVLVLWIRGSGKYIVLSLFATIYIGLLPRPPGPLPHALSTPLAQTLTTFLSVLHSLLILSPFGKR